MTPDDIIRMAREAGFTLQRGEWLFTEMLERFAALVAAAELRRLHAQRDALLEALKGIDKEFKKNGRQHWPEAVKARAAIAKAEENT